MPSQHKEGSRGGRQGTAEALLANTFVCFGTVIGFFFFFGREYICTLTRSYSTLTLARTVSPQQDASGQISSTSTSPSS